MHTENDQLTPYTVGLTGGIASGKSTVSDLLTARNITVIDTDELARECVLPGSPALERITGHFGKGVLTPSGSLNRSAVRSIIFSDPEEKKWLEECLHPLIRDMTYDRIKKSPSPYTVVAIPLLAEHYADYQWLDTIVLVDCSEEQQVERLIKRDNITQQEALTILAAQSTRSARQSVAHHIIMNDESQAKLCEQVDDLHHTLMGEVQARE